MIHFLLFKKQLEQRGMMQTAEINHLMPHFKLLKSEVNLLSHANNKQQTTLLDTSTAQLPWLSFKVLVHHKLCRWSTTICCTKSNITDHRQHKMFLQHTFLPCISLKYLQVGSATFFFSCEEALSILATKLSIMRMFVSIEKITTYCKWLSRRFQANTMYLLTSQVWRDQMTS